MKEGRGSGGLWKAEDMQEQCEGGVGDVRFQSRGRKGFVWNRSKGSLDTKEEKHRHDKCISLEFTWCHYFQQGFFEESHSILAHK